MTTQVVDEATGEVVETVTDGLATTDDAGGLGDPRATDLATAPLTWAALSKIAHTEFVPAGLRGKPDAVLAAVFTGREIGLDAMASLRLIDVIDGRPSLSAELTVALIRAAGHRITLAEETPESCTVHGIRAGDPADYMTVSYNLSDAERAGLVEIDGQGRPRARSRNGKPLPWETFTADLLWARAVSRLARRLFPDVLASPTRTAAAVFDAGVTTPDTAEIDFDANAIVTLGELLQEDPPSTAVEADVYLRRTCRIAIAAGIVERNTLQQILATFGATHVSDLRANEVRDAAAQAQRIITGAYATATATDRTITPRTEHAPPPTNTPLPAPTTRALEVDN